MTRGLRRVGSAALGGVLAGAGCTPHHLQREEPPPSLHAQWAARLGVDFPELAGPDPLAGGPDVWVREREISVYFPEGDRIESFAPPVGGFEEAGFLVAPLYDALALRPEEAPPGVDVIVDRAASFAALVRVVYTLGRVGVLRFHLVSGPRAAPGAFLVAPRAFSGPAARPRGPITDVDVDLALRWSADGVRAWALPRPAGRAPFDVDVEEPPPDSDDPLPLPDAVPIVAAPGADPPLDPAAVRSLVAALCDAGLGPIGLAFEPALETRMDEILVFFEAARAPGPCAGPRQWSALTVRSRASPLPIAGLRAAILALVPESARRLPEHVSPSLPDEPIRR